MRRSHRIINLAICSNAQESSNTTDIEDIIYSTDYETDEDIKISHFPGLEGTPSNTSSNLSITPNIIITDNYKIEENEKNVLETNSKLYLLTESEFSGFPNTETTAQQGTKNQNINNFLTKAATKKTDNNFDSLVSSSIRKILTDNGPAASPNDTPEEIAAKKHGLRDSEEFFSLSPFEFTSLGSNYQISPNMSEDVSERRGLSNFDLSGLSPFEEHSDCGQKDINSGSREEAAGLNSEFSDFSISGSEYRCDSDEGSSSSASTVKKKPIKVFLRRKISCSKTMDLSTSSAETPSLKIWKTHNETRNIVISESSEDELNAIIEYGNNEQILAKTCINAEDELMNMKGHSRQSNKKTNRQWNRRNCCCYCEDIVTNFTRHLKRHHKDEKEVRQYFSINDQDLKIRRKKRQAITNLLRNRGNYIYNCNIRNDESAEIIPNRRLKSENKANMFVICKVCLGTFKRNTFYRHSKFCSVEGNRNDSEKPKRVINSKSLNILRSIKGASEELKKYILPHLRNDNVSLVIHHDPLILAFGSRLFQKKKERRSRKFICSRMRDLAVLLLILREEDNDIKHFEDVINPIKYEVFINGVKQLCGFNNETGAVATTSIPSRLRPAVLGCIEILYTQLILNKDLSTAYKEDYKKRLDNFKLLLEANWQWEISSNAEKCRKRKLMTKPQILPLEHDIEMVMKKIHELEITYSDKLKQDITILNYENLCETTIAHIILLDRKRSGDAAEAELSFYLNRSHDDVPLDVVNYLTPIQRKAMDELDIFTIPGKRVRAVPILLTKVMRQNIDLLITCRNQLNIPDSNIYLFARPLTNEPFNGGNCLQRIKNLCKLQKPEMLTATGIRHHIATMSQLHASKNDKYTEHLAGFLGHDLNIHAQNYRLPLQALQKGVVGSRLMEIENAYLKVKDINAQNNGNILEQTSEHVQNHSMEIVEKTTKCIHNEIIITPMKENLHTKDKDKAYLKIKEYNTQKNGCIYMETFEHKQEHSMERVEDKTIKSKRNLSKTQTKKITSRPKGGKNKIDTETVNEGSDKMLRRIEKELGNFVTDGSFVETDTESIENENKTKSKKKEKLGNLRKNKIGIPNVDYNQKTIKRKKKSHIRWTDDERKVVMKYFNTEINKKINPGKAKCLHVIQKEKILYKRTWEQLNSYVNNIYTKKFK